MTLRQVSVASAKELISAASEPNDMEIFKNALRMLSKDIQSLTSLVGIGRDNNGSFIIQDINNVPGRFPNLLELSKDGILTLGNNYCTQPNLFANVKGSLYAVPQWTKFTCTNNQVAGAVVWDTVAFNNSGDLYNRTTGNTRVQIKVPGDYNYVATVLVDLGALLAAEGATLTATLNGTAIKISTITFQTIASSLDLFTMTVSGYVQTSVYTDYLTVVLAGITGAPTIIGTADPNTTFEICKVN